MSFLKTNNISKVTHVLMLTALTTILSATGCKDDSTKTNAEKVQLSDTANTSIATEKELLDVNDNNNLELTEQKDDKLIQAESVVASSLQESQPADNPSKTEQTATNKPITILDCAKFDSLLAKNSKQLTSVFSAMTSNQQYKNIEINKLAELLKNPQSMGCAIPKTKEKSIYILTSDDNKLRIYSWDTDTGGTMRYFKGYFQFLDNKGKIQVQPMTSKATSLFTVYLDDKPLYLFVSTGVYSTQSHEQMLKTLQVNESRLSNPKVIKTGSGLTDKLSFSYNFFSVVDRPERPIELFEFNQDDRTIRFPVVVEDEKYPYGRVTDKFIEYQFDGQYFQRVKN